jgi:hypothetical protein
MRMQRWLMAAGLGCVLCAGSQAPAQRTALSQDAAQAAPHRMRLIMKDGSYQMVMSYKVVGGRVVFVSAERGGETEEVPLALVDLDATKRWETRHASANGTTADGQRSAPVLDPELQKEEADRAALTPEVAPDLRLASEYTVLALDTFHGGSELVPMLQAESDLNKQTGHSVLRSMINPMAATHQLVQLKGEKAVVQLHVNDPVLYLKLDDDQPGSGEALTVDTHGASAAATSKTRRTGKSEYVIVRVDVRQDARVVASFNTSFTGSTKRQEDVVETDTTELPGGHWVKIVPRQPLLIGEYALVEILGERELNLGVWDFGVHPTAPENREVLRPEKRRASPLERHSRN